MTVNIIIAVLAGAIAMGLLIAAVMRKYMIRAYLMKAPYEVVCKNIEKAIKSVPGWGHPISDWDFHAAVSKTYHFNTLKKKRLFFICKAEYASSIVDECHHMGAMMPCAWAVYETNEGEVYLSKMDMGLMSKMFVGNIIGKIMGKVAREEHRMLKELNRLVAADMKQTA